MSVVPGYTKPLDAITQLCCLCAEAIEEASRQVNALATVAINSQRARQFAIRRGERAVAQLQKKFDAIKALTLPPSMWFDI